MKAILKIIGDIRKCVKRDALPLSFSGGGYVYVPVEKIMDSENFKRQLEASRQLEIDLATARSECEALRKDADECICKINWRQIIKESTPNLGMTYIDPEGNECVFFGVVWGDDDLYYGMFRKDNKATALLSCVCSIEGFGYTLKDATIEKEGSNRERAN